MANTLPQAPASAADNNAKTGTVVQTTVFSILLAISFSHLLNDTMQSLIPSTYPLLKESLHLDFAQVGLITFCFQLTAALLQPFVGLYTDKRPQPYSLAAGMCFTLAGLLLLSRAGSFPLVLVSVSLVGIGSSIFHPEASRIAYLASGGRRGLAQSIFQVGGNAGASIGPLLVAHIVTPYGQSNIIWFGVLALIAIGVLLKTGSWYRRNLGQRRKKNVTLSTETHPHFSNTRVAIALCILLVLIFSKYFYMASMSNYYIFFLKDKFHLADKTAQILLFVFLFAVAVGTFIGGPIGDRIGRKYVIWVSILGVTPFTLLLPYASLTGTVVLSVFVGLILASAFSAILVYAQELLPGKVGLISGLFFGLAFGMGGLGAAALGRLADKTSINHVFHLCAFLPLLGLLTALLPETKKPAAAGS